MKTTQRHPICITKFKRKQSICIPASNNENDRFNNQDPNNLTSNKNEVDQITKEVHVEQIGRSEGSILHAQSLNSAIEHHNVLSEEELKLKREREELVCKISSLESENCKLVMMNRYLKEKLEKEEKQKILLSTRIEVLENNFLNFQEEFEKQYEQSLKLTHKITPIDILPCTKAKQIDLQNEKKVMAGSVILSRRYSFSENIEPCEDLVSKVKEYKNQLEIEKLKRFNLERELSICNENARLSFKMEIDALNKKIELMRECINRKDKEISEKEDLISRHILNK